MEQDVMKALLAAFEESDWQEMTVTIGGDQLHVSRQSTNGSAPAPPAEAPAESAAGAPPAPPPAAAAAPAPPGTTSEPSIEDPPATHAKTAAIPGHGVTIDSPSVGLFWRAPAPGAPPFVEVGGTVAAGDTVAIVEVMKLMNHVTSPVSGTVIDVLPENGEAVEFGQVLVVVDPDQG